MCGIAGRFNHRSDEPVDPELVGRMSDLLAHRGPDDHGTFAEGPIGLGHRRLAVIDLTEAGHQPMSVGPLRIVFNGEIYNFRQLRETLVRSGHRFQSETDTEVILAAWREWGPACLERLQGMFAFAVWDAPNRALYLARDRVGKKPLCYWQDRRGLAFASEPKAFLADPAFEVRPDETALYHYLSLNYVPGPQSAFRGVERVPPGHYLAVKDGRVTLERYWRLRYLPARAITESEALDELRSRLGDAVRARLISDVPLGAFLSGGIDSGLVVALMAAAGGRVKTFSIGFEEKRYDELAFARQVADRYATDHRQFVVKPDAVTLLPKLVWHYNEPFADSSAIPTYCLAELTRQSVTVALNGDGGDESFAGYDRYRASALAGRADFLPHAARRLAGALGRMLPVPAALPRLERVKRFLAAMPLAPERRHATWMLALDESLKRELCTPAFRAAAAGADSAGVITRWYEQADAPDFLSATLAVDVNSYLPDDLLVKVDIATMAHALEARSPFLDHELMAFAASLPMAHKLRGRTQKVLLRRLARELLPGAIVARPKMGFGVPIDAWFRRDLREMTGDLLLDGRSRARGYFRPAVVERLFREHVAGTRRWHSVLWALLNFELWHRTFVDRTAAPTAGAGA